MGRPIISCRTSLTVNVRSIFISDVHLGTRGCQAAQLVDFLRDEAEHLFLIGDIIDFQAMSRGIYWSAEQNTVIQKVLRRALPRRTSHPDFRQSRRSAARICRHLVWRHSGCREHVHLCRRPPLSASASAIPSTRSHAIIAGSRFLATSPTIFWCASMPGSHGFGAPCASPVTGRWPAT